MNFKFHKLPAADANSGLGVLRVQAPHWAAEVRISNSDFEPVISTGSIKRDEGSETGYLFETSLAPGNYEVRISLEGRSASEWAAVDAGSATVVSPDAWKDLVFTSASPLQDISNSDPVHTTRAEELSKRRTDQRSQGDSCLFLFVRCLVSSAHKDIFCDGLELIDENEKVLTDFSEGIELNADEGWMAYRTDLPSGGYILRRGRRGVRLRYQPFYLCRDWETQIFLNADKFPSLSTWSLNMTRPGHGFHPDATTTRAVEAITDGLRYSADSYLILQNEEIERSLEVLLDEKFGNPWLGVLAAHVVMRFEREAESMKSQVDVEDASQRQQIGEHLEKAQEYGSVWRDKLRPFLVKNIGHHPDVRALTLTPDHLNGEPFTFPPSLLASLQLVRAHAIRNLETIPVDSMTDRLGGNVLTNSPWTAWRKLDDPESVERRKEKRLRTWKKVDPSFTVSSVLSQTVVPRTPVYRLAELDPDNETKSASETIMLDAAMIQKSKEVVLNYAKSFEMESIPQEVNINTMEEINSLLSVPPEKVSESFGIPLAKTKESLEALQGQASQLTGATQPTTPADTTLTSVQQAVLEYALYSPERAELESVSGLGKYVVREIVLKIQGEADRLLSASVSESKDARGLSSEMMAEFATRLYGIADNLLKHSDFVLLTDSRGKVLYCNGTFLLLISPRSIDRAQVTTEDINRIRLENQRNWEAVLRDAPKGISKVNHQALGGTWFEWKVSRTEINDESNERSSCFLNILRLIDHPPLNNERLEAISNIAGNFSLYVPLWLYGSAEHERDYISSIEKTIVELEQLEHTWRT